MGFIKRKNLSHYKNTTGKEHPASRMAGCFAHWNSIAETHDGGTLFSFKVRICLTIIYIDYMKLWCPKWQKCWFLYFVWNACLDTNIFWTSWYLQLLLVCLSLYICLNLWLAVAALTDLPVTSVHIYQLGGPSIWFLYTYLLRSCNSQWRHMCEGIKHVYWLSISNCSNQFHFSNLDIMCRKF